MQSFSSLTALNFLALTSQDFEFQVYRKPCDSSEPKGDGDWYRGSLPTLASRGRKSESARIFYWIVLTPEPGFKPFICHCRDNHSLTVYTLQHTLEAQALAANLSIERSRSRFDRSVRFKQSEHPEGWEIIQLEPYYLSAAEKFGFLIDFEFRMREDALFSRRVQQLSLSLDRNGKSNANFYVDRLEKIQTFVNRVLRKGPLFPFAGNYQEELEIEYALYPVESQTLVPRVYVAGKNKEGDSQLAALRQHGPLQPAEPPTQFHFVFSEQLRDYAADLYKSLNGVLNPNTFAGIEKVFGLPALSKDNTTGHKLRSFERTEIQQLIQKIQSASTAPIVLIAVLPNKELTAEYLNLKYYALQAEIPIQVVTAELIKNETTFSWSAAGIGLQIFAKLGGIPWKVKPSHQNCLIIGIGQAHQIRKQQSGQVTVEKYFAYSVLMDSSGIYKHIQTLGDSTHQEQYLTQLQTQIQKIIRQFRGEFSKFVIHTPYKLKYRELEAIKTSLEQCCRDVQLAELEFVVMKVNTQNKFFGYDRSSNSLVPPESSCLQLSAKEFLVWFEGIQQSRPKKINKRYAGPTHIEFYYTNRPLSYPDKMRYLQDVINLAGASWRGFNTKLLPVSIHYCQLIAQRIRDFQSRDYQNLKIDTSIPWFL